MSKIKLVINHNDPDYVSILVVMDESQDLVLALTNNSECYLSKQCHFCEEIVQSNTSASLFICNNALSGSVTQS